MDKTVRPRPYGGQAQFYDYEYQSYVDDIPFYLERLREREVNGALIELGVGTGRVAIRLAEAGYTVVGIDLSDPMLRRARYRLKALPPEVASRLSFSRRDITTFSLRQRFAAALIPFSTFNLLPTPALREACLERCHRHLEPGGVLYVDLFAPLPADVGATDTPRRSVETFRVPPYGHSIEKETVERYDPDHKVKTVRYTFRKKPYFGDKILSELVVEFALAPLDLEAVGGALEAAGFQVEAVYGDYRGRAFGPRSGRMIFEAVRR